MDFNAFCLDLFHFQYENNEVYRDFVKLLNVDVRAAKGIKDIPFLPVSFFKTHQLITGDKTTIREVFTSSGTTGLTTSRHYVSDPEFYLDNTVKNFTEFYGHPSQYEFLALLPGYAGREGSSLLKMADHFISLGEGGFYLENLDELTRKLQNSNSGKPVILIGVTFALLDLAEFVIKNNIRIAPVIIMETGGMKGRRKEIIREELHKLLCTAFNCKEIHSEYGMTELFSQAYSKTSGIFKCPETMKVIIRNPTDPFEILPTGKTGAINIIDVANIDSMAFIATDDLGKIQPDGSFEVLGRSDQSDVRGCNLLIG